MQRSEDEFIKPMQDIMGKLPPSGSAVNLDEIDRMFCDAFPDHKTVTYDGSELITIEPVKYDYKD